MKPQHSKSGAARGWSKVTRRAWHRVTVYEPLDVLGGALDAVGDPQTGYTGRGERELEAWMECLW